METQHEPSNVKQMPNTQTTLGTFTVFELETISQIMASRSQAGGGIKDLRLLQKVSNKVKAAIPKRPDAPVQKQNATPEEQTAFMAEIQTWQKTLETRVDETVEISFDSTDLMIIRQKVRGFTQFATDEEIRDRVLALADKLDIQ